MPDATTEFFERFGGNNPVPCQDLPPPIKGTIRVDIQRDSRIEQWFVTLSKGRVHVSQQESRPNAVVSGSEALFERLVRGEEQFYASMLRNEIKIEGDSALAAYFVRLLPGPPGAHDPRPGDRDRRATA